MVKVLIFVFLITILCNKSHAYVFPSNGKRISSRYYKHLVPYHSGVALLKIDFVFNLHHTASSSDGREELIKNIAVNNGIEHQAKSISHSRSSNNRVKQNTKQHFRDASSDKNKFADDPASIVKYMQQSPESITRNDILHLLLQFSKRNTPLLDLLTLKDVMNNLEKSIGRELIWDKSDIGRALYILKMCHPRTPFLSEYLRFMTEKIIATRGRELNGQSIASCLFGLQNLILNRDVERLLGALVVNILSTSSVIELNGQGVGMILYGE